MFIVNEGGDEFLFIRKKNHRASDIIISNSMREITLPDVDYCEVDGVNSEHNIFIDKQNSIDRTLVIDEGNIKVDELAMARIHQARDGLENRVISLFIDKDVSFEYLMDVELQLRMSNSLRVRYVLGENECETNNDSTRLLLNYFRTIRR